MIETSSTQSSRYLLALGFTAIGAVLIQTALLVVLLPFLIAMVHINGEVGFSLQSFFSRLFATHPAATLPFLAIGNFTAIVLVFAARDAKRKTLAVCVLVALALAVALVMSFGISSELALILTDGLID